MDFRSSLLGMGEMAKHTEHAEWGEKAKEAFGLLDEGTVTNSLHTFC
jgi:hypothetical protein